NISRLVYWPWPLRYWMASAPLRTTWRGFAKPAFLNAMRISRMSSGLSSAKRMVCGVSTNIVCFHALPLSREVKAQESMEQLATEDRRGKPVVHPKLTRGGAGKLVGVRKSAERGGDGSSP